MYCKFCGKQIDGNSVYCRHCGRRQTEDYTKVKSVISQFKPSKKEFDTKISTNPHNHKQLIYICIGLVSLILIIWGGVTLFGGSKIADITIDKVTPDLANAVQKYDEVNEFHEGLACVKIGDKYGFIDKLGHEIIPCEYDEESKCCNGRIVVTRDKKRGVINLDNKLIIPFIYDNIGTFRTFDDSVTVVRLNGKEGIIDLDGNVILPIKYKEVNQYSEG